VNIGHRVPFTMFFFGVGLCIGNDGVQGYSVYNRVNVFIDESMHFRKNSTEKRRKKQKKITESTENNENTIVKKKKEDYGIIKS
jgi:hypothetical protein